MEHLESIRVGHLTCDCAYAASSRICYILPPVRLIGQETVGTVVQPVRNHHHIRAWHGLGQ